MLRSTSDFLAKLKTQGELLEIKEEIDPHLDLAEIQRRVVAQHGPALLFKNVRGSTFPVATNLYGSEKRIDIAFSKRPEEFIKKIVAVAQDFFPPELGKIWRAKKLGWQLIKVGSKKVKEASVLDHQIPAANLKYLPQIKSWPEDGGAFITLPLVYTENPFTHKSNIGMYRVQLYDENRCGMHIQTHRGGGFHYHEAEKRSEPLPVQIYVGGPPALTLSAIAPLPEDVSEILFASLLAREKIRKIIKAEISPLPILADADFCIAGEIPSFERLPEGPFGDHYGYYSLRHDHPFVNVKNIFHRRGAVYPATVVGRPPQEDHYIANYLQELFRPLIHLVMPQVTELWAYEESGVHSAAGAIVKDRYPKEALTTALRILGEGQLSLTKILFVTDAACDIKDFRKFLPTVLERMDFATDLHVISHIPQDTLDYTTRTIGMGSKAVFLGVGKIKSKLATEFSDCFSKSVFSEPKMFCPGVLAVTGPAYHENDGAAELLAQEEALKNWSLVCLVDQSTAATKSASDFLWHVFTRFEPAADITAKKIRPHKFHFSLTPPVVIDCRLKPWYPKVLEVDPQTLKNVKPILNKCGFD